MAGKPEYVLLSLFVSLYDRRYGSKPIINRYKEKWGMIDVIESIGVAEAEECLRYYFKVNTTERHNLQFFYSNFDKMWDMIIKKKEDAEYRKMLMMKTKEVVNGK